MADGWKDDNCASMKAHYAVYSVPHAAALYKAQRSRRLYGDG
jgi:hypothetical protein